MDTMKRDKPFKDLFTNKTNIKNLINAVLSYQSGGKPQTVIKQIKWVIPQVQTSADSNKKYFFVDIFCCDNND